MKIILFVLTVLTFSCSTFAQWGFGGGLTLGSQMMVDKTKAINDDRSVDHQTGVGIYVRGDFLITDKWFVSPGFTFVIPSENSIFIYSAYQYYMDVHYFVASMGEYNFYGIAGLNYTKEKLESHVELVDDSGNEISKIRKQNNTGLNIGAGINYKSLFGELKYDSALEEFALSIGILF